MSASWKNRIVGHGEEVPDQILANPLNWRSHPALQQDAMLEVLDTVGLVQSVVVNKRTGHLVDGHLRVQLAMRRDEQSLPVVYVDLSEDEEKLVLATMDPLASMASADKDKLSELLGGLDVFDDKLSKMLESVKTQYGIGPSTQVNFTAKSSDQQLECPACGHKWMK